MNEASPARRRYAFAFLVVGAAVVAVTAAKDYPREQPIVFRLADLRAVTLTASFTKLGEAEARTGVVLNLPERTLPDVNHTIRVPNGDYLVTVDLRRARGGSGEKWESGPAAAARSSEETSVSRRVSLSGSEVVVPVPARASE
jgi:hypothetical protein